MSGKHNKIQVLTYNLHLSLVLREGYGFAWAVLLLIFNLNHFHPLPALILPPPNRAVTCEVEKVAHKSRLPSSPVPLPRL